MDNDIAIISFDVKELFNNKGDKLLPPEKLSENALKCISKIRKTKDGYKYTLHDKLKALNRLSLLV